MDIYDDLILDEPLPALTEEDIESLHRYLDEALEKCGDFCVQDFEDTVGV